MLWAIGYGLSVARDSGVHRRMLGFTYLWLLFFIVGAGLGLSIIANVWHTDSMREREKELLFVGNQYRRAIAAYYEGTPAGRPKQFPESLEDLLEDRRDVGGRRHLRRLYRDPITGAQDWGLIKTPDGSHIMGVYSLSTSTPIKQTGFTPRTAQFASAKSYGDWKFVHVAGTSATDDASMAVAGTLPQTPEHGEMGGILPTGLTTVAFTPVSPGGQAPSLEPPKPKSRCEKIAESDQITCDAMGARFDAETREQCVQSAQARALACAEGKSLLPALYLRY